MVMTDERLFPNEFVETLPELEPFHCPIIVILCRDTMPSNVKLREAIETWFKDVPADSKKDMQARLRSQDDNEHQSAFFELALHEYFKSKGFVVSKDPKLENGTTPDFRITFGDAEAYVEARTIMEDQNAALAQKLKNQALSQIHKISTSYMLSVHFESDPYTSVKPSKLRIEVGNWLKGLTLKEGEAAEAEIDAGGYRVEMRARNIGLPDGPGKVMFSGGPVRHLGASLGLMYRGIKKKAAKYKDIQNAKLPYVIAICSTDKIFVLEDIWMTLAAYGTLQSEPNKRGIFSIEEEDPRHPGISGILHCKLLQTREDFSVQVVFYENPSAGVPVPAEFKFTAQNKKDGATAQ